MGYDLIYWLLINVILISTVFGVIIDAFAGNLILPYIYYLRFKRLKK